MCLELSKNWREEVERLKSKKESIKAFKVLRVKERSASGEIFETPYRWSVVKNGENVSNRSAATKDVTYNEEVNGAVSYGLHFFVTFADADKAARYMAGLNNHLVTNYFILTVKLNPEDIVATGIDSLEYQSIVAMKANYDLSQVVPCVG